jgi:hypothetical protein
MKAGCRSDTFVTFRVQHLPRRTRRSHWLLTTDTVNVAVKLSRCGCGNQGMTVWFGTDIYAQMISRHYATRRMQNINMAHTAFRIKRPLYHNRAIVASVRQYCFAACVCKPKLQFCFPALSGDALCVVSKSGILQVCKHRLRLRPAKPCQLRRTANQSRR